MRRTGRLIRIATVLAAALATVLATVLAGAPAASASAPAASFAVPNPGVLFDGSRWVILDTGDWDHTGHILTAPSATGPWKRTSHRLLTGRPRWASNGNRSVWAPSLVRGGNGQYVAFYAAVVAGQKSARCIGTASSSSSTGPFVPATRPVACYSGSKAHAYDTIKTEGHNFGLIDPTPAAINGQLYLTYKTEHKRADGRWHTTIRLVQLNATDPRRTAPNPIHASGASIKITDSVNKYIEENPVLVVHGGVFTLFTSWGWYGTCKYSTRFRQNTSLWHGWLKKAPRPLAIPGGTCGTGNAQVVPGSAKGWRIFFNDHQGGKPHAPFLLYVGKVAWKSGLPSVPTLV